MGNMINQSASVGWRVGNTLYANKWHAIMAYLNQPTDYGFYCYDHVWDQVDWSHEPEETLKALEIDHCKFLRNKYNTIALAYSGGSDSNTVLQRFIDAEVHVDYIFCFNASNSGTHASSVEPSTAIRYLLQNQHLYPKTKLVFADEKLSTLEKLKNTNTIFDFAGDITAINFKLKHLPYGGDVCMRLKKEYPDLFGQLEDNNGCIVVGSNKPMVHRDSEGFWFTPMDVQDDNIEYYHNCDNTEKSELLEFFWTGSDPRLQIKQCHMVKRWMKMHDVSNANTVYKSRDPGAFKSINASFGRLPPIADIFSLKNSHGQVTNVAYMNQEFGSLGQSSIYAEILQSNAAEDRLKKLHNTLLDYNTDPKFQQFLSHRDRKFNLHGWLAKPRFLGT
jgi:hypothetical protein